MAVNVIDVPDVATVRVAVMDTLCVLTATVRMVATVLEMLSMVRQGWLLVRVVYTASPLAGI